MIDPFGSMITGHITSMKIIEDPNMVEPDGEDWSRVRSPARARRRRARGFPQRIVQKYKPMTCVYIVKKTNTMVMHPVVARELRETVRLGNLVEPVRSLWPR